MAVQPDPTRAPREAFAACLARFHDTSISARKSVESFTSELAQQCLEQERAYHAAMVRRDASSGTSQSEAESMAKEEIDYARQQARETYENSQPQ